MTNRQIRLKQRPLGVPTADDFSIVDEPMPVAQDGEVLRRTVYLSLDPYMRGRMSAARSYAPSVELGGLMVGGTVSEIVESRDPAFAKIFQTPGFMAHVLGDNRLHAIAASRCY